MSAINPADEPEVRAKAAIGEIEAHEDLIETLRRYRDDAIHAMRHEQGLRPPEIARRLGMSASLVRWVLNAERPNVH